jgi:hypothetical protein
MVHSLDEGRVIGPTETIPIQAKASCYRAL